MIQYRNLLYDVLLKGKSRGDRTGTGTLSLFGDQRRYDLSEGFPLVTSKRVPFKLVKGELLWFLRGSGNNNDLREITFGTGSDKETIWEEWAADDGYLGPIYGYQWRRWVDGEGNNIDQISQVIKALKENPESRRHIVSAWNVADLPNEEFSHVENVEVDAMALAPCHTMFQFYCEPISGQERMEMYEAKTLNDSDFFDKGSIPKYKLSCQLYQRSADLFLGVPFNIASYALLTHMVAQVCNMVPGEFIHTIGDAHIYNNHIEQVRTLLSRDIKPLPELVLNPRITSIDDFKMEDIKLEGYNPHPTIKAEVSV